ncbi:MAG: hypothetical protein ACRCTE_13630, partial [Cellulosilyticaceae bacterium]
MYREKIKNTILIVLIVLSIMQTAILWLGDSSGLNFLRRTNDEVKLMPIYPETTWVTLGEGTMADQIESTAEYTSRQYNRLVEELQSILQEQVKPSDLVKMPVVNWGDLLSIKGIWYDYGIPVTIDEIAGSKGEKFKSIPPINYIFLKASDSRGSSGQIFFINEQENIGYQANLKIHLTDIAKIIEAFTANRKLDDVTYQATITSNINGFIKENTFVPASVPLEYDVLQVSHPIKGDEAQRGAELEEYLGGFFESQMVKVEQKPDGSMSLLEPGKTRLVYKPNGMIEYLNLRTNRNQDKMTRIEGYNVALAFLEGSRSIPTSLKKHLYLTDIEVKNGEYTYSFDLMYDGYKVRLSDQLKQQLGIDSILQLTVSNQQIVSGRWILIEIDKAQERIPQSKAILQEGYREPIDKMLDQMQTTTPAAIVFEALECVYVLDHIEGIVGMKWS